MAIALLWAFEMPEHELRLRAAIEAALPGAFVTCSHEIDPTMMEYERTSTTVVNAYLGPLIQRYFAKVADEVERRGRPEPRIMQSNGGLASIRQAERRPAALLESGSGRGRRGVRAHRAPRWAPRTCSPSTWAARASTSR